MSTKYERLAGDLISQICDTVSGLTGQVPSVLADFESETGYLSLEVSEWRNAQRERHKAFHTNTSYAWVYHLSMYGRRVTLYISKLRVSIRELMNAPYLLDDPDIYFRPLTYKKAEKHVL